MIVKDYKVNYVCSNHVCKGASSTSVMNFQKVIKVANIGMELITQKKCSICNWPMRVKKIKCELVEDLFGDAARGQWRCKLHTESVFYPLPLKWTHSNAYDSLRFRNRFILYREVVAMGFPWRCPDCKEPLIYEEEPKTAAHFGMG